MRIKNWFVTLVIILVFGMMITVNLEAQTDSRLNGTWVYSMEEGEIKYMFLDGNYENIISIFEDAINDLVIFKGTYTTNGNKISLTITHLHGDVFEGMLESKLYSVDELKESTFSSMFLIDEFLISEIDYSLSENTLTMTEEGEKTVFIRE
jgi:hypothetical protein